MKTLLAGLLITCLLGVFEPLAAQDVFDDADANGDEVLVLSEVTAVLPAITKKLFDTVDQNADGVLDYDEYELGYVQGFLQPRQLPAPMNLTVSKRNQVPDS